MQRRTRFAIPSLVALVTALACGGDGTAAPISPPDAAISGSTVPGMEAFEQRVLDLMETYDIPGGAIAIVRDGRLVYARGFGYADVERGTRVQPDALFRIASISKPITAAAIMTLVQDGRLALDDRVAPLVAHLPPAPGAMVDARWEQITIRQLLDHTGGWDRARPGGFDPMDRPGIAAAAVGAPAPASAETIVRYMKGMPLDFTPGTKHVYSNFGFALLGRVIERVSGMRYEDYVRTRVLLPLGASRTRSGRSRLGDALPDEVRYYAPGVGAAWPLVPSVFPGEGAVPLNYGGYHLEAMDASGAWVSSTVDLLRFVNGVDGRASPPDILGPDIVAAMTTEGPSVCADASCHYAGGWYVRPVQGDATWWHGGDLPGTKGILVRSHTGVSWVALFNTAVSGNLGGQLDAALWSALAGAPAFPAGDQFSTFR